MKTPREHIGTLALCLSLLLHGSICYIMLGAFQRQTALQLRQPPLRQRQFTAAAPLIVPDAADPPDLRPVSAPPIAPPMPAAPPLGLATLPPIPTPAAPMPRPLAALPDIEEIPDIDTEFGQHDGKGHSMHASAGEVPMQARKGPQDQAWISRDAVGAADRNRLPSSDGGKADKPGPVAPEMLQPEAAEPAVVADLAANPRPAQPPFGVASPDRPAPRPPALTLPPVSPEHPTALGPGPLDPTAERTIPATRPAAQPEQLVALAKPPLASATRTRAPMQASPAISGAAGDNGIGKPGHAAADPAPISDSESDAFSTRGAAVFRNGKLEARFGRKVKTVRPRLNLAGQYDLLSLPSPSVIMKVRADQTGRVRNVDVIKSSGSAEVDQPCQLAMYEWWFEPPTDKSGKPQAAEMTWTIAWRR